MKEKEWKQDLKESLVSAVKYGLAAILCGMLGFMFQSRFLQGLGVIVFSMIFFNEAAKSLKKGFIITPTLPNDFDVTAGRDDKPFEFWLLVGFYAVVGVATAVTGILYMLRIID